METVSKQSIAEVMIDKVQKWTSANPTDVYSAYRNLAFKKLNEIGFPTRKSEEYKYANPEKLFRTEFDQISSQQENESIKNLIKKYAQIFTNAEFVVLRNGLLDKENSSKLVADILNTEAQRLLGRISSLEQDFFVCLNSSLFKDGVFIRAEKNTTIEKPFVVLNILDAENVLVNPRILIHAEQGSTINVIEISINLTKGNLSVCNLLTEVKVERNARANYYKLQHAGNTDQTISTLQVSQDKDSYFDTNTITLSGSWIRNNLTIVLNGTSCETHLNGLFITHHQQLVDNHTLVDHQMPHCNSNQLYKGVLKDKSTGVFNGKIFVRRDAQKTNAYQSSKNMLLSDDATINTKPQLEIYADDVRCSHGSSTGKIDNNALFYLKARGIGEESAKQLLMFAFANDVLNTIRIEEYRAYVESLLEEVL